MWQDDEPGTPEGYEEALKALERLQTEVDRLRADQLRLRAELDQTAARMDAIEASIRRHRRQDRVMLAVTLTMAALVAVIQWV